MKTWRRVIPAPSEIRPREPLRKEHREKPGVERTGSEPVEGQAWRRGMRTRHPGARLPGQPLSAPRTEADGGAQSRGDGRDAPEWSGGRRGEASRALPLEASLYQSPPTGVTDPAAPLLTLVPLVPGSPGSPVSPWKEQTQHDDPDDLRPTPQPPRP